MLRKCQDTRVEPQNNVTRCSTDSHTDTHVRAMSHGSWNPGPSGGKQEEPWDVLPVGCPSSQAQLPECTERVREPAFNTCSSLTGQPGVSPEASRPLGSQTHKRGAITGVFLKITIEPPFSHT